MDSTRRAVAVFLAMFNDRTKPAMRVLIIDSNERQARLRSEQLELDGHQPTVATVLEQTKLMLADAPDIVILSRLGTAAETIGLLRQLRAGELPGAEASVPVVALGADSETDQVRYYQAGADVALPTGASVLLVSAVVQTLGRREGGQSRKLLRIGGLLLDLDARTAHVDGQPLSLTRIEFGLLRTLAAEPHKTFTRQELTREVWGYDPRLAGPSRTLDTHSHRLRRKLTQAGCQQMLHRLHGVGWRLLG